MPADVGDIYQVAAVGRQGGQRIILTHYYRLAEINADVSDTDARDSLVLGVSDGAGGGDVLETTYLACLTEDYQLDYWRCQNIDPVRWAYVNLNRAVQGTHAGVSTTVNLGAAITLRTDAAGRKEHATKHIGPIPDDSATIVNGVLQAGYRATLTTFLGSLLSDVVDAAIGALWTPVIYNKGSVPNFRRVMNGIVGDTARVQRRRTVGLGE